jgi:uncharacterized protein YneF (UPF0154 family)
MKKINKIKIMTIINMYVLIVSININLTLPSTRTKDKSIRKNPKINQEPIQLIEEADPEE